jgi:glyoxylase-like metal-dependent hydrolase (beta-lactamase superfamily II)
MTAVHQPLVRQPSLLACCSAFARAPIGMIRPRRPDRDFLDRLVDAGLPTARQTARIRALEQIPKWVPTATVVEGTRSPGRIAIAMTAFVVEHPTARFLVDPGICADVGPRVISQLPAVLRAAVRPPADAIGTSAALGEQAVDFALQDRPISTFVLDGPGVSAFERSHDLFGDRSVLLVDLAGHTPGSVGILVNTASGWILLAGDAAWHTLQIENIRQKSSYPGEFADEDRDACFRSLHRLYAVKDQMRIVPTHDHTASAAMLGSG